MGDLYNKHVKGKGKSKGSGILQTTPDFKNKYGQTQTDVMNKKGAAIKTAETNFNKLRTAFKGFNFDQNTAKRFNSADSTNISNLEKSYAGFNKSLDSINKVNKDYVDKILPNDSSNKMLSPETTPLLQGAYSRGDAFIQDYEGQALMKGLENIQQNVSAQFNDPGATGKRQANRVKRREKRMSNNPKLDNEKFTNKTASIKDKSEANINKATINQRYKEWMINRNQTSNITPEMEALLNQGNKKKNDNKNIDPKTGKPYVGALTAEQKQAKIDAANAINAINKR